MEEGAPAPLGPQPHPRKQPRPLSLSLLTSARREGVEMEQIPASKGY